MRMLHSQGLLFWTLVLGVGGVGSLCEKGRGEVAGGVQIHWFRDQGGGSLSIGYGPTGLAVTFRRGQRPESKGKPGGRR